MSAGKHGEYKSEYNRLTAIHQKLRRLYGKANGCIFCGCSEKRRYEWSLIKGHEYSTDIKDYQSLCVPCHRKYDMTEEVIIKCSKASSRPIVDIVTGIRYKNITEAAKEFSINRSTLNHWLCGTRKNKTNLRYESIK